MNSSGALVAEPARGTVDLDETYGVLRAPVTADLGLVAPSARDEFNQTAGALTAKTAPVGGVWAGAGDTDDFAVETTGKTAQRTAVSDGGLGRYAISGAAAMTNCVVQVDLKASVAAVSEAGPIARYVDTSNYLLARRSTVGVPGFGYPVHLVKVVGGASTLIHAGFVSWTTLGAYATIRVRIDASGRWYIWAWLTGSSAELIGSGQDADLATGGVLASGKPGFLDRYPSAPANTRNYDNFQAWVPVADAVLHPNQSAELRWDGMYREDSTGTAYGPVSHVIGDLPRLPPTVEGSTTEVFIKVSRGDFDTLPDDGIDDLSARITYRPCWLTVPGA